MSAKQTAKSARNVYQKSLLLTHFWFEEDRDNYLKEVSPIFPEVQLSKEFAEYQI